MKHDLFLYMNHQRREFPLEDRRIVNHVKSGYSVVIGRDLSQRWSPDVVKIHNCDSDDTANKIMAEFFVALAETAELYIAGTPEKIRARQV